MIKIDFETFSESDLPKVGAWIYSTHPSTEVLCLAYKIDDKVFLWIKGDPPPVKLIFQIAAGKLFEAHNAFFEQCIWENICVKRMGWPAVPAKNWRCSAAAVANFALPRALGNVGLALNLSKTKDSEGKRIMLKLCKPRKPTINDSSTRHKDQRDYDKLYEYCIDDVWAEHAISEKIPQLSKQELKIWQLDQTINRRGIYADREAILAAMDIAAQSKIYNSKRVIKLTGGYLNGTSQVAKVKTWLAGQGVDIPNMQAETVRDFLKLDIPDNAKLMLEIRQSMSRTSTAKYPAMLRRLSDDDRIRDILLYYGASTGRWAGRGIQPHNFPRGGIKDNITAIEVLKRRDLGLIQAIYGEPMKFISYCLRGMLCAPDGRELICGDFAAIEARLLVWLAGDEKAVKLFHEGLDSYKDLAVDIYDLKNVDQVDSDQRFIGKRGILGLGYGMGWKKFIMTCKSVGDIVVSVVLAKKTVKTYRTKYESVVKFWKRVENAAIRAVRTGKLIECGPVQFGMRRGFLHCRLPSGRLLAWYDPKLKADTTPWGEPTTKLTFMGTGENYKWCRQETYGGKLVENITQAVARDCMAEALLRLEENNYPQVLTVHDEGLAEVKENYGSLEEYNQIMCEIPTWAKGCPIAVESWRGPRYKK